MSNESKNFKQAITNINELPDTIQEYLSTRIRVSFPELFIEIHEEFLFEEDKNPGFFYYTAPDIELSLQLICDKEKRYNVVQYDLPQNLDRKKNDGAPIVCHEGQLSIIGTDSFRQGYWIHTNPGYERVIQCSYIDGLIHGQYFIIDPKNVITEWYYLGVWISRFDVQDYVENDLLYTLCRLPHEIAQLIWDHVSH